MREIKFRAFLKSNQLMYNVLTLDIIDNKVLINNEEKQLRGYVKYQDVGLMQYTGLKDKNGKEIYDGDILIDEHNEEYCEVIFECGKFVCNFETNSIDLSDISDELIVIGNIYENKELIGDK